ncbi:NAD-dependent epimerase/dehydratase [Hydrogenobacter thermophilus TK-6]|uniref:NADH dehydrogenase n=1 Tax=Hydrogenobacter thermophilus (strain DSM 6534 / IAM 12695 / TK-6) TaxID=608538 RepID=D3DGL8_HYDTT|nr:NAD-dependent epimerase/dehydratase family protein [Hydrogenobacter thermophilus]ADO44905.1 NAD-dependent epimerase/dehydratase [Hydrogenobacter thermophilus TK-6]BAI68970.1 NADH dehydrogenase [Hydrogenobacter thermophilus TK-6]
MKVLITGSTGFVGRYMVKALLNEGFEVASIVRNLDKLRRLYGEKVKGYEGNFEDKASIRKAFEDFKPDYLIHLIGILYEEKSKGITFHKVHYIYSKNLYQVAKEFDIKKVLHMSALGTHKNAPSSYHKTKYQTEQELIKTGLNYTIFRPSIILGPEQRLFFDMWSITRYLRVIALPSGGHYLFQPVDVRDVVCCFLKAIKSEETNGKIYEVCGDKKVSFKKLLEDVFSYWNRKVLLLPMPKALMYLGGLLIERIMEPPPFSSDQMLMMWRDNICGLDPEVESQGVQKVCQKAPIPYQESLLWSLKEFKNLMIT